MNKKVYARDIADFVKGDLFGENMEVYGVSSILNLKPNTISFISGYDLKEDTSKGALILVKEDFNIISTSKNSYIKVKNPRLAFAKIIEKFFWKEKVNYISNTAIIGKNVKLGNNIYIGENVIIEDDVFIGNNTIIEHNVVIHKNSIIGENCRIASGVIIGNEGLSSLKDENGNLKMIRHLGNVIIEDFVEIGANSTVGKGTIDSTIIGKYTKIGPQANIGHNVVIGENTEIAGRAHISGSVRIGKDCFLGANCIIKDGISIGNNCKIGMGSVIINNLENNSVVMGLDAMDLRTLAKLKRNIKGY